MSDKLHRFFLENLHVRGEWVSLKESWQEIQKASNYPKAIQQVLGEALAAISLLAESLKFDGSLIMQIQGTAPVTMLVVQASSEGSIRGIARWKKGVEIPENATFNELFGAGTMVISVENKPKSGAQQGERYQSLVSLEGESLSECFSEYFAQSEQLKTKLWLAVNDQTAGGLLLQSLPSEGADGDDWNHAVVLAETLNNEKGKEELLSLDANVILHRLYHEESLRLYDPKTIKFECSCSQQKIENTVFSLGEDEANDIVKEQGNISVDCEFCNAHYELDNVDVARIFHADSISNGADGDNTGAGVVH